MASREITDLDPSLRPLAQQFLDQCAAASLHAIMTCTYRSNAEQAEDYAKGRTTDGPTVTDEPPGESAHNCTDYHENNPAAASVDGASTSLRCLWYDLHVVSHVAQTTGQVACGASMAQLIEVAAPQFAVVRPPGQHMVGCHQDLVCDSDRCTLRTAPSS